MKIDKIALITGRTLLGLYFIVPGISKFAAWQPTVDMMVQRNIPMAEPLLLIAAVANLVLGGMLLVNRYVWLAAYGCVAYILVINFSLHDFWNFPDAEVRHEMQNFVKNLAILAGALILASYSRK